MKMKKLIFIIAILLTALNGCDYLDVVPDNTATLEMAFHDRYNAEKFLFTCYSFIPSHGSENADPAIGAGDEIWYNEYVNRDGLRIAKGEQNVNNPLVNYWDGQRSGKKLFVGIRDCNIFIDISNSFTIGPSRNCCTSSNNSNFFIGRMRDGRSTTR
jgi:hypothetical protein